MSQSETHRGALEQLVFAEQIAMVYRLTRHTRAMSVIGSTMIMVTLWPSAPQPLLIVWYLLTMS